jgi:hypothetical protein
VFIFSRKNQVADLLEIQGVSEDGVELLGAVGVETCSALSQSDPGSLLEEIEHANSHLELVEELPTLDQLIVWIEQARSRSGEAEGRCDHSSRRSGRIGSDRGVEGFPVSRESIIKNEIAVGDVPVMDDFLQERDLYVEEVRKIDSEPSAITATVREIAPKGPSRAKTSREEVKIRTRIRPVRRSSL